MMVFSPKPHYGQTIQMLLLPAYFLLPISGKDLNKARALDAFRDTSPFPTGTLKYTGLNAQSLVQIEKFKRFFFRHGIGRHIVINSFPAINAYPADQMGYEPL